MLFYQLTSTRFAIFVVVFALSIVYMWLPFSVHFVLLSNEYFLKLAFMTLFSLVSMLIGFCVPLFDHRFKTGAVRLVISANVVHTLVWLVFLSFLFITLYTAPAIPLVSAVLGAGGEELSAQRGAFLKGRVGAEVALIYISTIFVSAFLPYSLARMFIDRHRWRYVLLLVFFAYSLSFLQKALFLNALLPLFYVAAQKKKISFTVAFAVAAACATLLYVVTLLSMGGGGEGAAMSGGILSPEFYSAKYLPSGPIDHLIWRVVAVPMFTAGDTLVVLKEQFANQPLLGATSSFLSGLFSLERVPLEKLVFEYEWGWNETANSNAVFFTEGYANFGWWGVWLYSFFVGQSFRWFKKTEDHAFRALWMIYFLGLFTGGLIGTLLSNGYILMFVACLFLRVRPSSEFGREQFGVGRHEPV